MRQQRSLGRPFDSVRRDFFFRRSYVFALSTPRKIFNNQQARSGSRRGLRTRCSEDSDATVLHAVLVASSCSCVCPSAFTSANAEQTSRAPTGEVRKLEQRRRSPEPLRRGRSHDSSSGHDSNRRPSVHEEQTSGARACRSISVVVITWDFESHDRGSNP